MKKWKVQIPKTSKRTDNRQIQIKLDDSQSLVFILKKDQYEFAFELDSSYEWVYNKSTSTKKTFEVFLVAQNSNKSYQQTKSLVPELVKEY